MAKLLGYPNYNSANLQYGILGRQVGEILGWDPLPKFKIEVLVDFKKPDNEWQWTMKPEVAEAIGRLGWAEERESKIPEEIDESDPIFEGAVKKIYVNAHERNSAARMMCIQHYGFKCTVCGVTLSDVYGEIAQGFIHVHHLRQLSEIDNEYQVNPIEDLRPVCPTCHAIIHLEKIPYSIESVQKLIESQRKK